jgi:protein-disulfide isomerase
VQLREENEQASNKSRAETRAAEMGGLKKLKQKMKKKIDKAIDLVEDTVQAATTTVFNQGGVDRGAFDVKAAEAIAAGVKVLTLLGVD